MPMYYCKCLIAVSIEEEIPIAGTQIEISCINSLYYDPEPVPYVQSLDAAYMLIASGVSRLVKLPGYLVGAVTQNLI